MQQSYSQLHKLLACSEGKADFACHTAALQARDKGKEPVKGDFIAVASPTTSEAQSTSTTQPLPNSNADFQPASNGNLQSGVRLRRPTKPASQPVLQSKATFSLPFVEQDDDFEAFAKSLHRYHSGMQLHSQGLQRVEHGVT